MSDPQPAHLKNKPPRAEPWQPDRPGSGTSQKRENDSDEASTEKPGEQRNSAIEDAREGRGRKPPAADR